MLMFRCLMFPLDFLFRQTFSFFFFLHCYSLFYPYILLLLLGLHFINNLSDKHFHFFLFTLYLLFYSYTLLLLIMLHSINSFFWKKPHFQFFWSRVELEILDFTKLGKWWFQQRVKICLNLLEFQWFSNFSILGHYLVNIYQTLTKLAYAWSFLAYAFFNE